MATLNRCVIENLEGRAMLSSTPIFGQHPMILVPNYQAPKPESEPAPVPVQTPPPVMSPVPQPVQAVIADAPEDLKARASRRVKAVCLKWDSVPADAKTVVVESSTDGQTFTTIGMLDGDEKKFRAKHLDVTKKYTFRVYTLDENNNASKVAEITPKWKC